MTRLPYTGRSWRIDVPPHVRLITANQRMTVAERISRTKEMRELGSWLALSRRIPKIQFAHIICYVLAVDDHRDRDPLNWAPTAKALTDGLAGDPVKGPSAQVLPDDSARHLLGPDLRIVPHCAHKGFMILIRELEYMPTEELPGEC